MAIDTTKNSDISKEQSITDNKSTPEVAGNPSVGVNENKTDMQSNTSKGDKTVDEKKDRRKGWNRHYDKLANSTPEELLPTSPDLKDAPNAKKLPSKAHEHKAKVEDDDLAYPEHDYDDEKLSEHDLLELGARETYM
ncbi:hypothetical protein F52700_8825 [Fusarium sp. NRRL 52700]|nr:hypothetical protein F52700_8825 [Fusarium sp. NRRL 52700]